MTSMYGPASAKLLHIYVYDATPSFDSLNIQYARPIDFILVVFDVFAYQITCDNFISR